MIESNSQLKQMYWLDGKWVYVDAENANNLDLLDSTDFASSMTEKRLDQSSSHLIFGNNNWSKVLYNVSANAIDSASYNQSNEGMGFTGVNKQYGISVHIPIASHFTYYIKVKIKRVSGDGNFSLGIQGLDNNFTPVGTAKMVVANNTTVTTTATTLTGKISGYGTGANQFTTGSNYFDIVFYTGQNGTASGSLFVIQSLEIIKVQDELYAGSNLVWHQGNFTPSTKADVTYVNSELAKRDTSINAKLESTHASIIGGSSIGHVKNGGNVTIASDGKISTTPSAIGAYTKTETDAAIDADVNTHAAIVGQTNLGHVKNGGNVTIAADGKLNTSPSAIGAYSKTETESLISVKLTDKVYVDTHIADSVKHITDAERTKWNAKADASGTTTKDFNAKTLTVAGNIVPTSNGTQTIGTSTNRFKAIYVDEAYLSTNTLYLGNTPIMGTEADTVNIKTDPDQSIVMKTSSTGSTTVTSDKSVNITTSGMNGTVTVQATGTNSQTNIAATTAVNLNAPKVNITGETVVNGNLTAKNLNVTGDFTIGGTLTTVNTDNLVISDNIIDINKGEVGQGVSEGMAGIKIDRGDLNDVLLVFDESDDKFKIGDSANLLALATEKYVYDNRYIHPAGTNPHGTTKADVGLGNVTNESKATMFTSPTFTGTPVAPTAASGTNTTQLATTAFVMTEVNKKANSSHGNHVPALQAANSYTFLRNDNTWQVIPSASTSQKGIVQLNNNINSTATDQAATPNAVKTAYDLAASKASTAVATTSANGLMSSSDKTKLDSIASGANVNQNAFSFVKVGTTNIEADNTTDTLELVAGTGITLTADATNDKITISGVNQYVHPTTDGNKHVPANGTTNNGKFLQATAAAGTYQWADLPVASTSAAGVVQLGTGATNAATGNHTHSYLPLSGGSLTGNLTVPSLKINVGEGFEIVGENDYFGTNQDARIFRAIDNNGNTVDGGIVFEGYGINGTAITRTEWLVMRQDVFTWKGNKIYHAGNKPTPADIGAATATHTHENLAVGDHNHDSVYQKKESTTFGLQTNYVAVRTPSRTAAQYYEFWDSGIGWADIKAGEFYANGNKVYHTGNKPTPADIGAAASSHTHSYLPLSGGTLTGTLIMPTDKYFTNGTSGINMKNSDIIGINSLVFNDEADGAEGLCWPKAGKTGASTVVTDYDVLKSYQSYLYYNTNKVYHEGFKPTAADIGAAASSHTHSYLPLSGGTVTGHVTLSDTKSIYLGKTNNYLTSSSNLVTLTSCDSIYIIADNDNSTTTEHVNIKAGNGTGIKVYKDRAEFNEKIVSKQEISMGSSSQASMRYNETTECIEFYFA